VSQPTAAVPARPDPSMWESPELRGAIASRNWGMVFAALRRRGYSQEELASITGYSCGEVAAITGGRPIFSYDAQLRVAKVLGVPLCLAGFASCAAWGCGPAW
jgi:hypothetical protein